MNRITTKRATVFIVVLVPIAVLINGAQNQSQRHSPSVSQQQSRQDVQASAPDPAVQRANYIARYLSPGRSRKTGIKTVAVVVVAENGKPNRAMNDAIVRRFKTEAVEILPALFTPEFFADGLFNDASPLTPAPLQV